MLSEVEHGVLESFLQSRLVPVVCLEVRLDERTFEATAVVESEGESVVLTHALNLAGYTFAEDGADISCLVHAGSFWVCHHSISSSWMRKLHASPSLSVHTASNHTPWSSGAPITWDALKPWFCSALTARSHLSFVMICCVCIRHILRHAPCRQGWWGGGTPQCVCTPCRCRFRRS